MSESPACQSCNKISFPLRDKWTPSCMKSESFDHIISGCLIALPPILAMCVRTAEFIVFLAISTLAFDMACLYSRLVVISDHTRRVFGISFCISFRSFLMNRVSFPLETEARSLPPRCTMRTSGACSRLRSDSTFGISWFHLMPLAPSHFVASLVIFGNAARFACACLPAQTTSDDPRIHTVVSVKSQERRTVTR